MQTNKNICVGAGLVSLDILIRGLDNNKPVSFSVGGTCGNVMTIMSYLGWDTYPIARLDNSHHTDLLLDDMKAYGVHVDYIITGKGKTPVIIQRNIIDKDGMPVHRFEFKGANGRMFLEYSPITLVQAKKIMQEINFVPKVFFFDRVSPAYIYMAKEFKAKGSLVCFEPSCKPTVPHFGECVEIADIIKFADQRLPDVSLFEGKNDKIIIQTLGRKGIKYCIKGAWHFVEPVQNDHIVDTSGAGDWTTSIFLTEICKNISDYKKEDVTNDMIYNALQVAQNWAAKSCSYEGARGMMEVKPSIIKLLK